MLEPKCPDSLGALADSSEFRHTPDITGFSKERLFDFLETMTTIREAERAIAQLVIDGHAKCPCHLAIGQEGVATGVSSILNHTDYVFGNHRSHGHYLALGSDLKKLMAEVLGKATGASHGMGGSMHLISQETGFIGSVPIVAGTIPIATGAALAAKMNGKKQVAISYFGDGATEEGGFHESMNLASAYQLPILFVCENNLYSSHLDIMVRQPADVISRYAHAHQIRYEMVDGNDVAEVSRKAGELIESVRAGKGPAFLEAVTYRWLGHVGPDENIDVGVRRSKEDLDAWKERDPIRRLYEALIKSDMITEKEYFTLQKKVSKSVKEAVQFAHESPYPDENLMMDIVYARSRNE